jgi:hypothetical protein
LLTYGEVGWGEWDKFVVSTPQYSLFVTSQWFSLFDKHAIIHGCYDDGVLIGGLPMVKQTNTLVSGGPMHPYTQYMGPCVMAEGKTSRVVTRNHDALETILSGFVHDAESIYCHPSWIDMRPFKNCGYQLDVRYTTVVTINGAWDNFEKQMRQRIKKNPVGTTSSDLRILYQLYADGGHAVCSEQFLFDIARLFKCHCVVDGKRGVFVVEDGDIAYFLIGVGEDTASLLWYLMERMGGKELDLLGCNNSGIARYKTGFGGSLRNYLGATH